MPELIHILPTEVCALMEQAQNLPLNGATVSLAWVPQTRAIRVVDSTAPVDLLLLEFYLENERRSGGGPLEGLRSLPGQLGTVVSFQQWQGKWHLKLGGPFLYARNSMCFLSSLFLQWLNGC